jgi:hypothetical protein
MNFTTLKLVYKNMTWNRSKLGLYGLVFFAGFCTANLFLSALRFGLATAIVLWFIGMPMVMTLIDLKVNPKRTEKIWESITNVQTAPKPQ